MPIADVYALQYTIPLFTILLAVIVLNSTLIFTVGEPALLAFLAPSLLCGQELLKSP